MKYENNRKVGGDFFSLNKGKRGNNTMEEYLNMFNINDYHIIKKTNTIRFLDETELGNYAGVLFLKKSIYTKEFLERWLNFNKKYMNINFLTKPFPPEYMLEKIKIIEKI